MLNADYKRIIEDIMYQENGWGIKFAELINIYSYYEFQLDWERKLGKTIQRVINNLHKDFRFDFENDSIEIDFTEEEIKNIKGNYDNHSLEIMNHFSNLIASYAFSRRYKLDRKEMDRSDSRFQYRLEELQKRVVYTNKMKNAKPSS